MAKFLTLSHLKIFFKSLKEKLSPVAFSGNYEDIIDTPELADVATSGDYNDLKNKPSGGIKRDDVVNIMDDELATVAFSGSYSDLANKPIIGNRITIGQLSNTTIGINATAEGVSDISEGQVSHSEGRINYAKGDCSHAEGENNLAVGASAHVEGKAGGLIISSIYVQSLISEKTYSLYTSSGQYPPSAGSQYEMNLTTGDFFYSTATKQIYTVTSYNESNHQVTFSEAITGTLPQLGFFYSTRFGAIGTASHAEGFLNKASGSYAHAEGYQTIASSYAHSEGQNTQASGTASHAEGKTTKATGNYSHSEGESTTASGASSHSEGQLTRAESNFSHAEGASTKVYGKYSHVEGYMNYVFNEASHAEGRGVNSFTFVAKYSENDDFIITTQPTQGKEIIPYQIVSITKNSTTYYGYIYNIGDNNTISVEFQSTVSGLEEDDSFTFTVYESGAYGKYSHTENNQTIAIGEGAHAEGKASKAVGNYSHAEGQAVKATGAYSHAEGETTSAIGTHSHAEGSSSIASGQYSHAEGFASQAQGYAAHAQGLSSHASGHYSHAEGENTVAKYRAQHVFGKYNIEDPASGLPLDTGTYVEIVGNGEHNARSNARTLDWNGNEVLAGTLTTSSSGITIGNTTITEVQLQQLLGLLNS